MAASIARHPSLAEAAPDLYQPSHLARGVASFADLDAGSWQQFAEDGFLVVDQAFSPATVAAALAGLDHLIDGGRPDFRGLQFEAAAPDEVESLSAGAKLRWIRKLMSFVDYEPRLHALAYDAGLQAALRDAMADEPLLFQSMALLKPPGIGSEKPWHQDCAYFDVPPDCGVIGVWIALDPATIENGCMHVLPGSHRPGPRLHWQRRDWQICDAEVTRDGQVAVPLEPGGALLFSGLLHHGTPPNRSDQPRRALQYHYQPRRTKAISRAERLAIYGSEGKDVEC
jgi:phytanoyl-CoA hydroxylase